MVLDHNDIIGVICVLGWNIIAIQELSVYGAGS